MNTDRQLWQYFKEIKVAVDAGNRGESTQPYQSGVFMVSALSGEIEFTVSDITEEDAVLIAGELKDMGVHAVVRGTVVCQHCKRRVPEQSYCVRCRTQLN